MVTPSIHLKLDVIALHKRKKFDANLKAAFFQAILAQCRIACKVIKKEANEKKELELDYLF